MTTTRQLDGADRPGPLRLLDALTRGRALGPRRLLEEHPELETTAHNDLFDRARPGAFIYTIVWVIVTVWYDLWSEHRWVAGANMAALVGLSALRLINIRRFKATAGSRSFQWLVALILIGALHWGVLSSWVIFSGRLDELRNPFMIMLPAFAMGGTAVLGISAVVRVVYPTLIFTPTLVAGALIGGQENNVLVTLALCSLTYVLVATRASAADYWNATYNAKVAEIRAEQLEAQSITDPLTGVHNRLHFNNRFEEYWHLCARTQQPLALIMVDLDHFKRVNDTYGHLAGDECLKAVAAVLSTCVRRSIDILARYGGEEFIAILPQTDFEQALVIADRIVTEVDESHIEHDGTIIPLTCSVGLAVVVPDRRLADGERLLAAVDEALYDAKAGGRNRLAVATGTSSSS